jgi:hypothetical protein
MTLNKMSAKMLSVMQQNVVMAIGDYYFFLPLQRRGPFASKEKKGEESKAKKKKKFAEYLSGGTRQRWFDRHCAGSCFGEGHVAMCLPSASLCRVSCSMFVVCNLFAERFSLPLGKGAALLSFLRLPSVIWFALDKGLVCRVPEKRNLANLGTLGVQPFSCSVHGLI